MENKETTLTWGKKFVCNLSKIESNFVSNYITSYGTVPTKNGKTLDAVRSDFWGLKERQITVNFPSQNCRWKIKALMKQITVSVDGDYLQIILQWVSTTSPILEDYKERWSLLKWLHIK